MQAPHIITPRELYDANLVQGLKEAADSFVSTQDIKLGERVLIWYDGPRNIMVEQAMRSVQAKGGEVKFFERNMGKDIDLAKRLTPETIPTLFQEEATLMKWSERVLIIRVDTPHEMLSKLPQEIRDAYDKGYSATHAKRINGTVPWALTLWPTASDAALDGISYPDFVRSYLKASKQDWTEKQRVQALVIEECLNPAETLRFVVNKEDADPRRRTDLTLSVKNMTFCNSVVLRNFPGSEMFSGPVRESAEGQVFAPGSFVYEGYQMKDLFFRFYKGRIIEAAAAQGQQDLETILSQGPGANYLGEIALGTNGGLEHQSNHPLLAEKRARSFHFAIGHCYSHTTYAGMPVSVDNGNTIQLTPVHWDIAVSMRKEQGGGETYLDDRLFQINGKFIDSRFDALN